MVFSAGGCDAAFERVGAAGGEVLQEPIDQPHGVRDRACRDPAGDTIRLTRSRKR